MTGVPSGTTTPSSRVTDIVESGAVLPIPMVECVPFGNPVMYSAAVNLCCSPSATSLKSINPTSFFGVAKQ